MFSSNSLACFSFSLPISSAMKFFDHTVTSILISLEIHLICSDFLLGPFNSLQLLQILFELRFLTFFDAHITHPVVS